MVDLWYYKFHAWLVRKNIDADEQETIQDVFKWLIDKLCLAPLSAICQLIEEAGVPGENHRPRATNW